MKIDLERIFLKKHYISILNVAIASILFILYKVGVSSGRLIPFLVVWLLFYLITSITESKFRYDSIKKSIGTINKASPLITHLVSIKEAYDYLSFRLKYANTFKNTIFNINPGDIQVLREQFVLATLERLKNDAFEMYEIVSTNTANIDEIKNKSRISRNNYYFSIISHPSAPLLPFSIISAPKSKELILGWYGAINKPYQKDIYLVIKDERIVALFEDYFDKAFELGKKEFD